MLKSSQALRPESASTADTFATNTPEETNFVIFCWKANSLENSGYNICGALSFVSKTKIKTFVVEESFGEPESSTLTEICNTGICS